MARELQNRVLGLIEGALDVTMEREVCPDWLNRPGAADCGRLWPTVQTIYRDLTSSTLPDEMPPRERRSIDAVLVDADGTPRIVEVDEVQHFTPPRAQTFNHYPAGTVTAFDRTVWAGRAAAATKVRGGGWGRACPPLFPEVGGRHLQRAFRDALADVLPAQHGWAPTLRIADFEVKHWLHDVSAPDRMLTLLQSKGVV